MTNFTFEYTTTKNTEQGKVKSNSLQFGYEAETEEELLSLIPSHMTVTNIKRMNDKELANTYY